MYSEDTYGYGRVSVESPESLSFEFVSTTDGLVHDSVRINNGWDFAGRCTAPGKVMGRKAGPEKEASKGRSGLLSRGEQAIRWAAPAFLSKVSAHDVRLQERGRSASWRGSGAG